MSTRRTGGADERARRQTALLGHTQLASRARPSARGRGLPARSASGETVPCLWPPGQPDRRAKQPITMLNDRVLVKIPRDEGERHVTGGILIPATAQVCQASGLGRGGGRRSQRPQHQIGDQVLFIAEDRYEVEVRGDDYLILRERDIHAVASERIEGRRGCTCNRSGRHRSVATPMRPARHRRQPGATSAVRLQRRRPGARHRPGPRHRQGADDGVDERVALRRTLD